VAERVDGDRRGRAELTGAGAEGAGGADEFAGFGELLDPDPRRTRRRP
jgi:hypothetical protein